MKTLMISIIGLAVLIGVGYWFVQGSFGPGGNDGDDISAAAVHNTIWTWLNGTVGRATGLRSAGQEEGFVEDHFW